MRVIKILIISLFILIFLLNCSEENNNNYYNPKLNPIKLINLKCSTYIYNHGINPLWYASSFYIIFESSVLPFILMIYFDGNDLNTIFDYNNYGFNYIKICSMSDDYYILFTVSSTKLGGNYLIYYFQSHSESRQINLTGMCPIVHGNLSGKYNITYLHDDDFNIPGYSVYQSDINGSEPIKILDECVDSEIDLSPDGKKLTYCDENNLILYDITNKEKSILYSHYDNIYCPRFSPDGEYIAFSATNYNETNKKARVVWLLQINSGIPPKTITEYPYYDGDGVGSLSWSYDEKWIVYDIDGHELWKVRVFE